jgi:hypothetical protein
VLFSGLFTFGVTHEENDRLLDIALKFTLSILAGYVMMPIYLGSWFDLNNRKK